ncbi:hypothetical protein [Actinomadura harenae]|uniref:hypothetical protein n=1 Tax=Actinomadura harenae TaxID=2483351 RepID=UPI001315791F|nr:hypothetical protein [Actinomadura harenae]
MEQQRTRGEVRIVGAERPGGLELRTAGLAARGMTELRVTGLAWYLGSGWSQVLGELVRRIAAAGPGHPTTFDLGEEGDVTINLVPDGDFLAPHPPPGVSLSVADWRRDVVDRLFPTASS